MSLFEERVEAAAEGMWDRYGDRGMFTHAPEHMREAFKTDARAALLAADAVVTEEVPRVQLYAQRGGKTSRVIDQILDRADERGLTIEVVYPTPTEEELERVLSGAFQGWTDQEDPFGDQARAVMSLFRGGAK